MWPSILAVCDGLIVYLCELGSGEASYFGGHVGMHVNLVRSVTDKVVVVVKRQVDHGYHQNWLIVTLLDWTNTMQQCLNKQRLILK